MNKIIIVIPIRHDAEKLDRAVFAAYGWPDDLSDEEILERLLALNLQRAGEGSSSS